MDNQLAMELSPTESEWLDRAVACGRFHSREEAIHAILKRAMSVPADEEVEDAYRRAHKLVPENAAWGRAGLALLTRRLKDV
jgi:Arc/MetJ-type ribon-helix-helix transcriptional regulator